MWGNLKIRIAAKQNTFAVVFVNLNHNSSFINRENIFLKRQQKKSTKKSKISKPISAPTVKEESLPTTTSDSQFSQSVLTAISNKEPKKSKPVTRHWLTNKLRRLSYQWPPRKEAIRLARVARGKYRCNSCMGEDFGPKEIQLDHIIPVVDEEIGFVDWNTYIERLFCGVENFQVLCKPCHDTKTFFEQQIRKQVKREKNDEQEDI